MKCKCLAAIVAKMLQHQAELAQHLATDHQVTNYSRRFQLADEIRTNAADFAAFLAEFQIQVKKRDGKPSPGGCK